MPDVTDRYEGTGARLGSFWFLPTLDAGLFYDSNIYATSGNETGSLGTYIAPRLELESNWGRHALNLMLAADEFIYFDDSSINRTNVYGSADGKFDIARDLSGRAAPRGGSSRSRSGTSTPSMMPRSQRSIRPSTRWSTLNKAFNRIEVSVGGSLRLHALL